MIAASNVESLSVTSDRRRTPRRWLIRLTAAALGGICLWLLASLVIAHQLIQRAQVQHAEPAPAVRWGKIEPLRIATSDGEDLGAWFIAGRGDTPLVLLLHGNGGDRTACLDQAELLAKADCPVLMISHRAHGDSTGKLNDFGYSARRDVLAAVDWLEHKHPGRPIVVWGRSLGSAAALFAAEELGDRVNGYILECPYQDLRTALWNRADHYLPPLLDLAAFAGLRVAAPVVLPDFDSISPCNAACCVSPSARCLLLAGEADRRARSEEAQAIQRNLRGRSELIVIPGGDHLELHQADSQRYRSVVVEFLEAF